MRRVVVTGMGIVSSLGNNIVEVLDSLRLGKSGIRHSHEYAEMGMKSLVHGAIKLSQSDLEAHIDRKKFRFMGNAHAYAHLAMQEAILDANLPPQMVSDFQTGLIVGTGGISCKNLIESADTFREKGIRRVSSFMVPRIMSNGVAASLATDFKIKGINYAISSACATSAHCIGAAMEQIQLNKQDIVFAGGAEEEHWSSAFLFDAMGALSTKYNDNPECASRPYDTDRDGFVISGGSGIIVLEDYEHAINRGAKIYAEIIGYAATSDGYDMVAPSGEGAERCMRIALNNVKAKVDYINTHGTSTKVGDIKELEAIMQVFGNHQPYISSTKSLSGHALGAAGVNEVIYTLLMMQHEFIPASANIENMDIAAKPFNIVTHAIQQIEIDIAMSNSFGFGGTNATLVLKNLNN